MNISAQVAVILSSMYALAKGAASGALSALGITELDYRLTTSETPWIASERGTVARTFEGLLFGAIDQLGIPRFEIPAEYLAGAIITFISAQNQLVACIWFSQLANRTTSEIANNINDEYEGVSPEKLFALTQMALSDKNCGHCAEYREKFEQKVGLAMEKSTKEVKK